MPIQIGQKKESDFSDPLGLLSDCHRRIEHFLAALVKISNQAQGGPLDAETRNVLKRALAYFRNAAPKHTADEEESLFPRMRALGQSQAALARLADLEHEHKLASCDHDLVDAIGNRWLEQDELPPAERICLSEALERLSRIYSRHISVEDSELFPLAAECLPPEELAKVGREMAERRGITR